MHVRHGRHHARPTLAALAAEIRISVWRRLASAWSSYHHSARPPREKRPAETVEVASFLRMVGYARLGPMPRGAIVNGREGDLLTFCKYCWRPAASAALVCRFHSVQKRGDGVAAAQYKQAQRLQRSFEALVNRRRPPNAP